MSDNDDLLGDDLGDQSLADYNLGNEEEEQLLADDYESGSQNVPTSIGSGYREGVDIVHDLDYGSQVVLQQSCHLPLPYQAVAEAECVVPNITVEIPNMPVPDHSTYAPYEPPVYQQPVYEPEHAVVPPPIPAAPMESPQIVPSEMTAPLPNGDPGGHRERFISERPPGTQRLPQVRDIPDSLDKVVIPRGRSWRSPQFAARFPHPYRRSNAHRGNFNQRSFPPPLIRSNPPPIRPNIRPDLRPDIRSDLRPDIRPDFRPDIRPDFRPDIRPDFRPDIRPDLRPDMRHEPPNLPQMGQVMSPERAILPDMSFRPPMERPFQPNFPRFQFRPNMDERPTFGPMRPHFDRPMFPYQRQFNPRSFPPPLREIIPNSVSHMPQVTIRQGLPGLPMDKDKFVQIAGREPEVRMLPVPLPANLPPGGLAGKKVLINPHFKGNFQPPVEGLPSYIPTRIQKSPPLSPTLENKFGPIKDIDDAAERFIAEQRNALARAAGRKLPRRSPQRYIENTTIEIENELADEDLLRRQEEFIHANRAGLRRRMRSASPPAVGSRSPRRSPDRRRPDPAPQTAPHAGRHTDEDSEYRRRVREQESLRERVLRAKEVRRRKNAVALHRQNQDRERDTREKMVQKLEDPKPEPPVDSKPTSTEPDNKPDTTRKSPEKVEKSQQTRARSPIRVAEEETEVNSTCENLTPPRAPVAVPAPAPAPARAPAPVRGASPARAPLTPPLPRPTDSDDDLDLILGDIDGILSEDEDRRPDPPPSDATKSKPQADLRSKLHPKSGGERKPQRQKIIFGEQKEERKRKEKSPARRAVVTSSTKADDTENSNRKSAKTKQKAELAAAKSRQKIIFDSKQAEKDKNDDKKSFSNRRVILQRKITQAPKDKSVFNRISGKSDPSQPNPGIFSRAVRTAIAPARAAPPARAPAPAPARAPAPAPARAPAPAPARAPHEPQVEYASDSDIDEDELLSEETGNVAAVGNLPHGMTDTRLNTLAGSDVQSLILDKEERTAKITFKTTVAAESFKKKFNNKMVAASRLTVILR